MSRRKRRTGTIPQKIPSPQRVGWDALLDLYYHEGPKALECVVWMLDKLDRRERPGIREMARECEIRPQTASKILTGLWRAWADSVLSGNTLENLQAQVPHELQDKLSKFRETLGNTANGPKSRALIGERAHD